MQLDTICDRTATSSLNLGSTAVPISSFGDHTLHHLFPGRAFSQNLKFSKSRFLAYFEPLIKAVDGAVLDKFYPKFLEVMKDYKGWWFEGYSVVLINRIRSRNRPIDF